jgi:hypothetical protein
MQWVLYLEAFNTNLSSFDFKAQNLQAEVFHIYEIS